MAAGKYTFIIEQGATTDFEVVWKDGAGTPINLSSILPDESTLITAGTLPI